jgi:sugar-specific transcriptional regulator TrmB
MSMPTLQSLGLTATESQLYELLLSSGEVPAAELIRESQLKRPTVYKALYSLEKKGLVQQKEIEKKIHFRPNSPTLLLEQAEQKFQEISQTRNMLQTVIPQMLTSYTLSVERPVVQIYEGVEGLKQIYQDTLKVGQDIDAILQTSEVDPELFHWLTTTYAKQRAKHKIHAKVIVASGKWSADYRKKDIEEYRTTRQVSDKLFPFQHEVNIYKDKVAFINYKKGEQLLGVVIKHPQIALTMKALFDLAWVGASESK